jgi:N6-L-threonylcarbamoyladenine synthase
MSAIDGIAYTRGPGMKGCLTICSTAGRSLSAALNVPVVGVHHMQAHALTAFLTADSIEDQPRYPFLSVLISGGHTMVLLAKSPTSFKILANTVDISIGYTSAVYSIPTLILISYI